MRPYLHVFAFGSTRVSGRGVFGRGVSGRSSGSVCVFVERGEAIIIYVAKMHEPNARTTTINQYMGPDRRDRQKHHYQTVTRDTRLVELQPEAELWPKAELWPNSLLPTILL